MNDSPETHHPEDLLCFHALHALDPAEAELVQAHVDVCPRCQQSLADELHTLAFLGRLVEQRPPSPSLQTRVMRAVEESEPPVRSVGQATPTALPHLRWDRLVLPVAASLAVVLLGASLVMHYVTTSRIERLEQEKRDLELLLSQSLATEAQERHTIGQLQAASYMVADPTTLRLALEPVHSRDAPYQGVLLLSEDGQHAMLLVAGMSPPSPPWDYQVWLLRSDKKVAVGELTVGTGGWGTASLLPQESVFGFEWVALSASEGTEAAPSSDTMLLRTRITPRSSSR